MPPPRPPDDALTAWARAHAATVPGGPPATPTPRPTGPWHLEMDADLRFLGPADIAAVGERPDGTTIVATAHDGDIAWWDPRDGTLLAERPTRNAYWLAFTPPAVDPPRMVSIRHHDDDESVVQVWDLSSFTPTIDHRVRGMVPEKCLVRSPGGSALLACCIGTAIELRDLETGRREGRIETGLAPEQWAFAAATTVDDVFIAQANDQRAVLSSVRWSSTIEVDLSEYQSRLSESILTLLADGRQPRLALGIGGRDAVHVWDIDRGVLSKSGSLPADHAWSVLSVQGRAGPAIHVVGAGEISCWNAETFERLAAVPAPLGTFNVVDARLSDDVLTVVTSRRRQEAHLWTGRIVHDGVKQTGPVAATVPHDWTGVRLVDDVPREMQGLNRDTWSVAWRPAAEGQVPQLGAAGFSGAYVWDVETGELLATPEAGSPSRAAIHWSPDGEHLATAGPGDRVQIWRSSDFELANARSFGSETSAESVRWSPDGKVLAVAGDRRVHLWRPFSSEPPVAAPFESPNTHVWTHVVWSRSGDAVITGDLLKIWKPPAMTNTLTIAGSTSYPIAAVWSPIDDRVAVATAQPHDVLIIDAKTDTEVMRLRGHTDHPWSVRWSDDGGCIVSAGDKTARLWHPQTGTELLRIEHPGDVRSVELYEDRPGHALLATGGDGGVRVWELDGIRPAAGSAPGPYIRPRELGGAVRVLVRLAGVGVHSPLGLLADLVAVLGGKPPADERLLTIPDWAGVARLRALGWPAPARGGLAALLVTEIPATSVLVPPDGATPGELRSALDAAIGTTAGRAPRPPLNAIRRADAAVTDELVGLLAVVGPDAVADDPALPLRLRDQAACTTPVDPDRRVALLATPPPTSGPGRRRAHSPMPGFDLAGIARNGRPSALLPSQLALPEDVLAARLLTVDLQYRRYDHPVDPAAGALALVLDTGPATFGPVEALLRLAAHRLAQRMWNRGGHIVVFTTDLPGIPRELRTPADLAHVWSGRTVAATDLATTIAVAHRTGLPLLVAAHHHTIYDHAIHPDAQLALLTTHTPGEPHPRAVTHPHHRHLPPNTPPTELDHHLEPLLPT